MCFGKLAIFKEANLKPRIEGKTNKRAYFSYAPKGDYCSTPDSGKVDDLITRRTRVTQSQLDKTANSKNKKYTNELSQ